MAKLRYPLVQEFMNRSGNIGGSDAYMQNAVLEHYHKKIYVSRRPGNSFLSDFGVVADPKGAFFFNGLLYGVYNDTLYVGGASNIGASGTAFTQSAVPSWYGRSFFTATVFQDRIYVIGGEAAQLLADVSYTSDGVKWSTNAGAAPFGHRQGHQVVVFNNQLWLIGGFQNDASVSALKNDVWTSKDGATWDLVTDNAAWTARDNHTVVVANNGMYLYGGNVGGGVMKDDVWFSTDGQTWTNLTMAATGTPRQGQSMLAFNNKLWIIGGSNAATTPLNDVWSSAAGQTWVQATASAFATGRTFMGSTVYNNKMWLISGGTVSAGDSNVYSSTNGSTWNLITTTPGFGARVGAAAVTFKTPSTVNSYRYDTMWLLGGFFSTELQEVWRANLNSSLAATYALSPTVSGQNYQFNTFINSTKLLIKNQSNFWVLESGTLTPVVDTNYPPVTVPGLVVLNSFAYVLTPEAEIRACALDNPLSWPSLQFDDADYDDDSGGVAIAKYLNYVVVFGKFTVQFLYDAGNPAPGIPLAVYQGAEAKVGCAFAQSVQSIKNTLIWIGNGTTGNWGVYLLDGITPKKVSTEWIDKVLALNVDSTVETWTTGEQGHTFYVINLPNAGFKAIAYDMDTNSWAIWVGAFANDMPYSFAVSEFSGQNNSIWYGTRALGGKLYSASFSLTTDAGVPFTRIVQTDKLDADTMQRKFWGRLDFVGDQAVGAVLIEVSDDDYTSFQVWGFVNLAQQRPYLNRGGASRRRAFRLQETDVVQPRWEAIELTVSEGES